ncbi:MAG TPA: hypothetical protein VML96_10605 [Egibacteraceae bacterium]|nr:hypothetical protein [Egibacteraceae bacterium]
MAQEGYSGTPLARKLGIKAGAAVALLGAPEGFALTDLPDGVDVRSRAAGRLDVIVLFARSQAELARRFPAAMRVLEPAGGLWVAWPKKASGVATDLSFEVVQPRGLDAGLVDNKICAIDETWSGLRFVYRLRDRPSRDAH